MPTSTIWMKAMPTTPCATVRTVWVQSLATSGPRSLPKMRLLMRSVARCPSSPKAMMMPATARAAMNTRTTTPRPASVPTTCMELARICGASGCRNAARSVEAFDQTPYTCLPTRGHSATSAGGGGMWMVPLLAVCSRSWIDPKAETLMK